LKLGEDPAAPAFKTVVKRDVLVSFSRAVRTYSVGSAPALPHEAQGDDGGAITEAGQCLKQAKADMRL